MTTHTLRRAVAAILTVLTLLSFCAIAPKRAEAAGSAIETRMDEVYGLFQRWRTYKTGATDGLAYFTTTGKPCAEIRTSCTVCNLKDVTAALKKAGFIDFTYKWSSTSCYAFCQFTMRYVFGNQVLARGNNTKTTLEKASEQSTDTIRNWIEKNVKVGD